MKLTETQHRPNMLVFARYAAVAKQNKQTKQQIEEEEPFKSLYMR